VLASLALGEELEFACGGVAGACEFWETAGSARAADRRTTDTGTDFEEIKLI
jgi:hypothetical protein